MTLTVFFTVSAAEAVTPSWFPKVSCRDAWRGRDLAKFDFTQDTVRSKDGNVGYSKYQARLAKEKISRRSCYKDWAVLIYMAGDNDLSPYALWDLDEMEGRFEASRTAGSTLKSDLLVQVDTAGATGIRRLHMFQREDQAYVAATSKADYLKRKPSDVQSPIVKLFAEPARNSADQRLQAFLDWGVREYPAENYMVIVWGHGQGWSAGLPDPSEPDPFAAAPSIASKPIVSVLDELNRLPQPPPGRFGGIMANSATGAALSILNLRDVLGHVVEETLEGKRLAVYASDACLMQMAEVAHEIAPYARFISGSAQVQTFLGLPYRRLMYELNSGRFLSVAGSVGKTDEALLVAKMLPILSERSLDPVHGQQGRAEPIARETFSMSTLSSEALLSELTPATRNLSHALQAFLAEDIFRASDLALVMKKAPSFMGGGKEFGSFLSLIELARQTEISKTGDETRASKNLSIAIANARQALDRTVIERRFGTSYQTGNTQFHLLGYRGLGVWIPTGSREYKERASDFALSSWENQTDWQAWLRPALGVRP